MWNSRYQNLYERTKSIIKVDTSVKFYNEKEPLYPQIDISGVGLGAGLLQARDRMWLSRNKAPKTQYCDQ